MSLVYVATPQTESELAVMLSLLEANDIPAHVQNGGFGGLHPGPLINHYNARRILVPRDCAEAAGEILGVLQQPDESAPAPRASALNERLRVILEACLFGWFIPSQRYRRTARDRDAGTHEPSEEKP